MIKNATVKGVPMPRIQGRVTGDIEKQFSWELFITIGDSEPLTMEPKESEPRYATFDLALKKLREMAQDVADTISKDVYKAKPEGYFDLINNRKVESLK